MLRAVIYQINSSRSQQLVRAPRCLVLDGSNTSRLLGCHRQSAAHHLDVQLVHEAHPIVCMKGSRGLRTFSTASGNGQVEASADFPGRQLRLSHILVPANRAAILDKAEEEFAGGAAFAKLAELHSACPSSSQGGDLGWVTKGKLVKEAEDAAFRTPVGQLVRCETRFGLHLFFVADERKLVEVEQMGVLELAELLEAQGASGDIQFLDVREPHEHETASLPHFALMPLSSAFRPEDVRVLAITCAVGYPGGTNLSLYYTMCDLRVDEGLRIQEWADTLDQELDREALTVVLCHHGVRSMNVANFLVERGFQRVVNVSGGIDAYSRLADRSVPRY